MGEQDLTKIEDTAAAEIAGGTDTAEAQSASAETLAKLQERNQALEHEMTKLRQEAAAKRVKAREATEAKQQALEENSQFKELSEHLKGSVGAFEQENAALKAQLESASSQAALWQQYKEAEGARIAAESEALTEGQQAILSAIPEDNIAARAQALSVFTQSVRGPNKPPPQGAPAAAAANVNFDGIQDPAQLRELINQYPEAWKAYTNKGVSSGATGGTFIGRVLSKGH